MRFFSRRYRAIAFNARGYPPSDVPGRREGVLAGARGRRHPGRARRAEDPQGPRLRPLDGRLSRRCTSASRTRTRALSLVVAGAGYGSVARRAREVPQGHRDRRAPLRGRRAWRRRPRCTRGARRASSSWTRIPSAGANSTRSSRTGSAKGHALTQRGVQMLRPSILDLGPAAREARRADADHDRRRGRPVPRAGLLHEAQDPDGRARRPAEVGPHHQPGGARGVQPRRARLPHRGRRREVDAPQSRVADGLGHPSRGETLDATTTRRLHGPRSHPRPLRPDRRAPARRHGRQRHQGRDARGDGGRLHRDRLRLPEPAPEQALDDARPQASARGRDHQEDRRARRRASSRTSGRTSRSGSASTTRRCPR